MPQLTDNDDASIFPPVGPGAVEIATVLAGPAGPVGPEGPEGPQGPQGVQGPAGPDGVTQGELDAALSTIVGPTFIDLQSYDVPLDGTSSAVQSVADAIADNGSGVLTFKSAVFNFPGAVSGLELPADKVFSVQGQGGKSYLTTLNFPDAAPQDGEVRAAIRLRRNGSQIRGIRAVGRNLNAALGTNPNPKRAGVEIWDQTSVDDCLFQGFESAGLVYGNHIKVNNFQGRDSLFGLLYAAGGNFTFGDSSVADCDLSSNKLASIAVAGSSTIDASTLKGVQLGNVPIGIYLGAKAVGGPKGAIQGSVFIDVTFEQCGEHWIWDEGYGTANGRSIVDMVWIGGGGGAGAVGEDLAFDPAYRRAGQPEPDYLVKVDEWRDNYVLSPKGHSRNSTFGFLGTAGVIRATSMENFTWSDASRVLDLAAGASKVVVSSGNTPTSVYLNRGWGSAPTGDLSTAWQSLTLANNWTVFDALNPPMVRLNKIGQVEFKGLISGGTLGANVAVLPAQFRPGSVAAGTDDGNRYRHDIVSANNAPAAMVITEAGAIQITNGSTVWVNLSGFTPYQAGK